LRLLPGYCEGARTGFMNPTPSYAVAQPYPAFAVLDADRGFGLAAGCRAIDIGVGLARSAAARAPPAAASQSIDLKFTGLTQNLGQLIYLRLL
jgi:hypothetical protein